MAQIKDLSLRDRAFLAGYRWRRIDPVPWTPLTKPLRACRLALVSTAGLVLPEQEPFDQAIRGGDDSVRFIPADADVRDMIDTHRSRSYDHAGVRADPNLAFPLDRARELVDAGRIGSLSPVHLSLMGSLTATGRFSRHVAPEAAARLRAVGADIALLVPV